MTTTFNSSTTKTNGIKRDPAFFKAIAEVYAEMRSLAYDILDRVAEGDTGDLAPYAAGIMTEYAEYADINDRAAYQILHLGKVAYPEADIPSHEQIDYAFPRSAWSNWVMFLDRGHPARAEYGNVAGEVRSTRGAQNRPATRN